MDVDIWAWVGDIQRQLHEAGNTNLAMAIGGIPAQALEGRYGQLDMLAPAVAQEAEKLGLPWLEFYARYWHLIGRVGDRAQGAVALDDARALAEFARREDVRDCPSAPGAVEALVLALANTDGPGHAAERMELLAAAGIEPGSPAYAAYAEQYVAALVDAGRAEEAVAHAESAVEKLGGAGREASWELGAASARSLLAAGRPQDALTALDAAAGFKPDDPVAKAYREGVLRALVLATLDRTPEAVEALPDLDVVGDHPRVWVEWARAVLKLASSEQITNTWQLGRILKQWIDYFAVMGAHRARVELALVAGDLAMDRKGIWQARLLADLAQSAAFELKDPAAVTDRIAGLRAAADATTPLAPPGPQDELVGYFDAADGFNADPERWVGWLAPISGQDIEATRRHTTTLGFLGYPAVGADVYWDMLVETGRIEAAEEDDVSFLTGLLVEARQDERLEQMAGRLPAGRRHLALARLHRARERWEQAAAEAEAAVGAGAGAEARRIWAAAVQQLGDNAKGARILRELLDGEELEGEDVWRMITMATAAEDWETVRAGAAKIGMPIKPGEGPIEEEMGLARIVLPAPDGSQRAVISVRTGPATARLEMPQPPGLGFNAGDVVVFDPALLEPVPESPEEQERFIPTFAAVGVLRPAGYTSWFFDGVRPDDSEWTEFTEVMVERGWPMWVYSNENYTVTHPGTGESLPGVYGWIAIPPDATPVELDAVLDDVTERWAHPLAWLDLAKAVGVEVERHERITQEYGL
ncbi:tetratricopeptide repeat protein [Planomonospora corallina]|uniref:Tetratricopeptide repeat protein n=1 Tax=Planomonospora corallina TaxID=1806052 RepID=A0ABV8I5F5_9ACTN